MGGVRVTREQKIAEAKRLAESGLSHAQIGMRLGMSASCIWKWLNPEQAKAAEREQNARRGPAKRAWEDGQRANCEDCGCLLGMGSSMPCRKAGKCRSCHQLSRVEQVESRARRIEALWAEGLTLRQIAAELGWTVNHISVEIQNLREKGYNLPYRYSPRSRDAMKFPDQVAS